MHFQNHMHCRPKHQCSLIFAAPVFFFSFLCEAHLKFSQFAMVDPVDFFSFKNAMCQKRSFFFFLPTLLILGAEEMLPCYLFHEKSFWTARQFMHKKHGTEWNLNLSPLLWLIKFDGKSRIRSDANENHLLSSSKVSSTHWPRRNGQLEMIWGHS